MISSTFDSTEFVRLNLDREHFLSVYFLFKFDKTLTFDQTVELYPFGLGQIAI